MEKNTPARLIYGACLAFGVLAGVGLTGRPAQAQALSGFDVYRSNCTGCHELYDPEDPKRTRQQWDAILTRMVKVRGATLDKQEYTAVLNYLDSFNRPKRVIQWVESPAQSHKAAFKAADAGKPLADWVELTMGADEQIPWAVQGDATGKSAFVQPLKSAGERQFPALIDNTGILQNGVVTARMQMVSGKGAVGAGVIFGFRNPQSYFGVRIGPRDVVLYQVQGGAPSLLARSATAAPLKAWQTVSVEVNGKEVKVSLNGKALPELTRTLDAYKGGRAGLNTQADTVALFDQWEVAVK